MDAANRMVGLPTFPLIQLPRKSEGVVCATWLAITLVSINSTSEEVRSLCGYPTDTFYIVTFPLIQLPRKSEVVNNGESTDETNEVSINSTSEEVRSSSSVMGR